MEVGRRGAAVDVIVVGASVEGVEAGITGDEVFAVTGIDGIIAVATGRKHAASSGAAPSDTNRSASVIVCAAITIPCDKVCLNKLSKRR